MIKIHRAGLVAAMLLGAAHTLHAAPILTDWASATSTSSHGDLGGVTVTFSALSATINPGVVSFFGGFSNPAIYSPPIAGTEAIAFEGDRGIAGFKYSVSFDAPVQNPILYIASLASVLTFDSGISLTKISGENVFSVSGNTVSGVTDDIKRQPNNDANGVVQINGIFTNFAFDAVWNFPSTTDNDGITIQIGGSILPTRLPEPSTILLLSAVFAGSLLYRHRTSKGI